MCYSKKYLGHFKFFGDVLSLQGNIYLSETKYYWVRRKSLSIRPVSLGGQAKANNAAVSNNLFAKIVAETIASSNSVTWHSSLGMGAIEPRCVSNQIFKYSIPNSGTIWFQGETPNTKKQKSIWYFTITNTDFIWCASNHRALSLNPAPIWQIDFKSSNHIVQNIKWSQFRFDTYYLKWWFDSVFIGFDIGIFK